MTLGGGEHNYQANREGQEQRDPDRRLAKGMQWGQGVIEGEISLRRRENGKRLLTTNQPWH